MTIYHGHSGSADELIIKGRDKKYETCGESVVYSSVIGR